jgi:hypothetical protein
VLTADAERYIGTVDDAADEAKEGRQHAATVSHVPHVQLRRKRGPPPSTHPPAAIALDQHAACIQRHPALLLALKHVVGCGGDVEQRANVNGRISSEVEARGGQVAGVGDKLRKSSEARCFMLGRQRAPGRT